MHEKGTLLTCPFPPKVHARNSRVCTRYPVMDRNYVRHTVNVDPVISISLRCVSLITYHKLHHTTGKNPMNALCAFSVPRGSLLPPQDEQQHELTHNT